MGARLLRRWVAQPLTQLAPLEWRQEQVSRYVEDTVRRGELREVLKNIGDIERLVNRVLQGVARPDDLRRLRDGLRTLPRVAALVDDSLFPNMEAIDDDLTSAFDVCADALDLLERSICEEGGDKGDGIERPPQPAIRTGYDAELDAVMTTLTTLHDELHRWEEREREQTAIKSLKITCHKGGWVIVTAKSTPGHLIPVTYHRVPGGTSDDRWTTYELQEHETLLQRNRARLQELERTALARVIADVAAHKQQLLGAARTLAEIDV
ncbi:MAG: DNA mismatch repair protein MutS, partial [uncultured Chloroflexia bacterium]